MNNGKIDQDFETPDQTPKPNTIHVANNKGSLFKVLVIFVPLIVFCLLLLVLFSGKNSQNKQVIAITPTPTPKQSSQAVRTDLERASEILEATDLENNQFQPPNLDLKVDFKN